MTDTPRDIAQIDAPVLYGEDLRAGDFMALGSVAVTRDEIIEFGRRYDPLPIHVDPDVAARTHFGDVIAPAALLMALYSSLASRQFNPRIALIAGKGIEHLRIPKAAVPGTTLTGQIAVDEVVSRGDRCDLWCTSTFVDQEEQMVLAFTAISTVLARRDSRPEVATITARPKWR